MKKIGIYLASNQKSGGIFQYNINFIKALDELKKYFEMDKERKILFDEIKALKH